MIWDHRLSIKCGICHRRIHPLVDSIVIAEQMPSRPIGIHSGCIGQPENRLH